jgi:hypothetical protein
VTIFIIEIGGGNPNIENIKNDNAVNIPQNEQHRSLSSTSRREEHVNDFIDEKMKELENTFELKLGLAEKENKENKEAFQRNFDLLQQEKLQQDEENTQLKERLARLEAQLEENTNNYLNYDSTESVNSGDNNSNYDTEIDNSSDYNNDINYDSECSDGEEDTNHNTSNNTRQNTNNHASNEIYADPNYDSSDNENRTNDICLD